jgi:hypothetical protein
LPRIEQSGLVIPLFINIVNSSVVIAPRTLEEQREDKPLGQPVRGETRHAVAAASYTQHGNSL